MNLYDKLSIGFWGVILSAVVYVSNMIVSQEYILHGV